MFMSKSKKVIKPKAPAARREQPAPPSETRSLSAVAAPPGEDQRSKQVSEQASRPLESTLEASTTDAATPIQDSAESLLSETTAHNAVNKDTEQPVGSTTIDFAQLLHEPSLQRKATPPANTPVSIQAPTTTENVPQSVSQGALGSHISKSKKQIKPKVSVPRRQLKDALETQGTGSQPIDGREQIQAACHDLPNAPEHLSEATVIPTPTEAHPQNNISNRHLDEDITHQDRVTLSEVLHSFSNPVPSAQLVTPPPTQPSTTPSGAPSAPTESTAQSSSKRQRTQAAQRSVEAISESSIFVDGDSAPAESSTTTVQNSKQVRKRKALTNEGERSDTQPEGQAKKRRVMQPAQRKKSNARQGRSQKEDGVAAEARSSSGKRRGRKRKQNPVAEDVEDYEVVTNEVLMSDLCKDNHQGKVSTREHRLRERDKQDEVRLKEDARAAARGELADFMANPESGIQGNSNGNRRLSETSARGQLPAPATTASKAFQLVNGRLVPTEAPKSTSRRMNQATRAAAIAAETDDADEVVVEDDLSQRITSRSFGNFAKPYKWTAEMNERFFRAIQLFGQEFSMMAMLFPSKTRKQLKHKYMRERKADPAYVDGLEAQSKAGQLRPTVEELHVLLGRDTMDPQELDRRMEAQRELLEEEQREEDQLNEQRRRVREEEAAREAKGMGRELRTRERESNSAEDQLAEREGQEEGGGIGA